jgi:hypothetical protein
MKRPVFGDVNKDCNCTSFRYDRCNRVMLIRNATVCHTVNTVSINKDLICLQRHTSVRTLFVFPLL